MKRKFLTMLLAIAATLCLCFGISACGKTGFSVEGTYYLVERDEYDMKTYFILKGGKWTDEDGVSGDYAISGEKITLYTDLFGEKAEFTSGTLKDGVLTLEAVYGDKVFAQEGAWSKASGSNGGSGSQTPSAQEYTVTYNANGGEFASGDSTYTQTVKEGNKLTAPTSPTRKNYTFAGWAKSKNGSDMWKFDEDTVSSGITLWATWSQESAVILSVEGASIDGREIFMLVDHTTGEVSLSGMVVCSDDSIWRLYSDPEGQREIPTKMVTNLNNGDNEYYIVVNSQNQAQVNVYTLTVHRSYLVTVSYYDEESLLETTETYTGDTFTASYTPDITGYTFNGWERGGSAFTSAVLWAPLSLYADKTANTYKVTLDVNKGDALSETEKTLTYDKTYSLPVPKRMGYSFTGWYLGSEQVTNKNGKSLAVWNYTRAQEFTAHWEANQYTVTLKQSDSEAGTVSGGGDHAYDSQVTITATTNSGYTFLGWYEGDEKVSSDLSYKFKMGFATTYTAKWIECPVTLVKDVSAGGTVSGVDKTVAGKVTTITAKTNSGYTWLGWYQEDKELTREFSYKFTMPDSAAGAVTYTAKWIKCPVTIKSSDTSIGTVSGLPSTTVIGEQITVKATSSIRLGCEWLGWYNGGIKLAETYTYTFNLGQEVQNLTAKYQVKSEMQNFEFTSSTTQCNITNIKDKKVDHIFVPDYVTSIAQGAFKGCDQLTSIDLPFVGANNALANSSELSVFGYIFDYNVVEDYVYVDSRNTGYTKGSDEIYTPRPSSDTTRQYEVKIKDVKLKQYVNGSYTGTRSGTLFRHYDYYIPATLKEVKIRGGQILERAFYACDKLTSIQIPETLTKYSDYSFFGCKSLTEIPKSENATYIGMYAFSYCSGIINLHIPEGIEKIDPCAFQYCNGITDVYVPSTLSYFGLYAFSDCKSLVNVHISDLISWCHMESHGNDYNSLMRGHNLYLNEELVEHLEIPDEVVEISEDAFVGCVSLKSVKINLEKIAAYSFYDCTNIQKIIVGANVKSIGSFAFSRCSSLKEIFYEGTEDLWNQINLNISGNSNEYFPSATKYFYSKTTPSTNQWDQSSNWWHYDEATGEIAIWKKPE